jgi:hypothetical protein
MHENHKIFVRGLERQTRVKLTFYSRKHRRNIVRSCAPLHYSEGPGAGDDKDCYYFWDFEARKGSNFLALAPSKIVGMEPTEDAFRVEELVDAIGHQ